MAGRLRGDGGGIFGLIDLLAEHGEAVEYDLIRAGLRLDDLGTERLSWRELKVVVRNTPANESALRRAQSPEDSPWTATTLLLAEAVDALRTLAWMKTKDGQKNRNRPQPIPRPGHRPTIHGKGAVPIEEIESWLEQFKST
jgi:hypothetical protein